MTTEETSSENPETTEETEDEVIEMGDLWTHIQEPMKTLITEMLNPFQALLSSDNGKQTNENNGPPALTVNNQETTTTTRKPRKKVIRLNKRA